MRGRQTSWEAYSMYKRMPSRDYTNSADRVENPGACNFSFLNTINGSFPSLFLICPLYKKEKGRDSTSFYCGASIFLPVLQIAENSYRSPSLSFQ
uniref:Uncharacterized protein n=1 Tax=Nelumbo nucifera TaxID=4432 RepID=A0A822Y6T4_NELNU|nr:TPA_asm: hypothetical protein HUJ06_028344 [Nelumbo nucifera]